MTWVCFEWPGAGRHSGGVGRYAYRLASELRGLVDLTVVCRDEPLPLDGVAFRSAGASHGRVGRYYLDPLRVSRLVRDSRPQLVHAFGDDWALTTDVPRVRTFLGSSWEEARSSTGLRAANHYLLAALEEVAARRSDRRIAIADESAARFRAHDVVPPVLGTSTPDIRRVSPTPSAVFVGSHGGRKRGWLAERAIEALRSSGTPVELIVIGPEDDASAWKTWVDHRAGLTDAGVREVMAQTWALLAPSTYEGFGIPIFEALVAGVPVVASSNPGSRYIAGGVLPAQALSLVDDDTGFEAAVRGTLDLQGRWSVEVAALVAERVETIAAAGSAATQLRIYESVVTSPRT